MYKLMHRQGTSLIQQLVAAELLIAKTALFNQTADSKNKGHICIACHRSNQIKSKYI